MKHPRTISRKKFIQQVATAGVVTALSPLSVPAAASARVVGPAKIRVGLIGCGSVSGMYLPHLTKSAYAEVVSVCDIIPERARAAADRYKIPNHYPNITALLAGAPFDLLVNLTDMQEHGRLNKIALDAGKNVWSEKPMANTYREGLALLNAAKQKGLRIWGAPAVVNSPQFAFMAQAVQDGMIGKVAAAHAHYGHLGPTWSAFFYEKGGGSLPDLGVYNLATLTGILGPARFVTAMTNILTPERTVDNKGKIRVEAEDNAMVLMQHESGALSHVQCGFNYFDPYGHGGDGQDKPTISLVGTKGSMHLIGYDWHPFGVDVATVDNEKGSRYAADPGTYVWEQGASVICEAMATGKEPRINAEHALHVLEVIEAARKASATGRRVALKSSFKLSI
jgi:predicted dehydrogenase